MDESLGMIQAVGLTAAYCAADAGLKAAHVSLIGVERVDGYGWIMIRFSGGVSNVQAAVEAGVAAAKMINPDVQGHVIARPAWSNKNETKGVKEK